MKRLNAHCALFLTVCWIALAATAFLTLKLPALALAMLGGALLTWAGCLDSLMRQKRRWGAMRDDAYRLGMEQAAKMVIPFHEDAARMVLRRVVEMEGEAQ